MSKVIKKAAVIGSGIMGSGIAAHLANAGIKTLLLDIVPSVLTKEEEKAGLTFEHPKVRSRLATDAIAKLAKTSPAPLYEPSFAKRITPGNIEDHLSQLADVDWIIEVVVENLEVKKNLFSRIEKVWKKGTIISSNTSGISIAAMSEHLSEAMQEHFLGTHFFNPPRYMKLLELIPGPKTDEAILATVKQCCERVLGKGVVMAKDTPNFIANRIGTFGFLVTLYEMEKAGLTVEEVDAITGPALGRPKSATFRTLDLVGLDTFMHVSNNVYNQATSEGERELFAPHPILQRLVAEGALGEKTGRGFYKKQKSEKGTEILSLKLASFEYVPQKKPASASLEAAKLAKGARAKTKALIGAGDHYSKFAWSILKQVFIYSAELLGEIAETIEDIDAAMKWGFNWELGPFEAWDALGLVKTVERIKAEGSSVPAWVDQWVAAGNTSFYKQEDNKDFVYCPSAKGYKEIVQPKEIIRLKALKQSNKVIKANSGASLIDLGDGVACLEFHSPNNAIGGDILSMINQSVEEVRQNYKGLVIANQGKNFCVGANIMLLLMEAQDEEWDEVDDIIRLFQNAMMNLKRLEKPVVAAPHRMTLGGGVEACIPADQIVAAAETYFGLVEVGVGLIPAGGGCKELALWASNQLPNPEDDLQPLINRIFEMIGTAKVSTSGHDAKRLGYFRAHDKIVLNDDYLIYEAKQAVLAMDQAGYEPRQEQKIRVVGAEGKAVLELGALGMYQSGYISEHDLKIAKKLAHVLAGGDVPAGTYVSEQYMLDLEREAFLSLCMEPKTQARMEHMLKKGKPLRN